MVPEPLWSLTLQKSMSPVDWAELRADTLDRAGHRCQACGERGRLECHEGWSYDDQRLRQRLAGLWALCEPCHAAKTPGRLSWLESSGQIGAGAYDLAVERIARLNGWRQREAEAYVDWCNRVNTVRSRYEWTPYARPHARARDLLMPPQLDEVTCGGCFVLAPAGDVVDGLGSCCR